MRRRKLDVPSIPNLMTFFLLASMGLPWAQQSNKCSTADNRSTTGSIISSPGLTRADVNSITAVTTTPTDTDNVSQSVSSTFVSAETCRSHIGTPTAITRANVEAAPYVEIALRA